MVDLSDKNDEKITILDIFPENEVTQTSSAYKMICPDCGLQGGRTEGFILFPESNSAYCHSSGKHFRLLEVFALRKGIIKCLDGRETGESSAKILGGELFTLTLEEFKNEYGTEKYNILSNQLNIRKQIRLMGDNRLASTFSDDLGDIYKTRNVLFFRGESRDIVEIGRYKKINSKGEEYKESGFIPISKNRFITLAEMFINPWTYATGISGKKKVKRSMTNAMASIVLESPNFQNKLPIISRIFDIQIPIMYKGKLTFVKKGYDKRFGSWLPYNAPEIKKDLLTLDESKALIDKIFEEFCFATDKDRTHAIAGFITPFLRGLFPKFSTRTPVFIYMANRERAGKDYCAGVTGILYEGANTEEPAFSNDEKGYSNSNEEIRKKIMACMIQGKKRFHSSNNKGLLNNSIFEGVTTAETWSDRILGRSHIVTFNNEIDYSLSGNLGIKLTPDLSNRARIVNLHLVEEDANAREFKNPKLHEWILENRDIIISAIYKLIENWYEKGMQKGSIPFTSFPVWSSVCGGIMEANGYDNPCKRDQTAIISLDYETEEMKKIFESCYKTYPEKWIKKDEIINVILNEDLMDVDVTNKGDMTKVGIKFERFVNRMLSGILMQTYSKDAKFSRQEFKFTKNSVAGKKNTDADVHLVHDVHLPNPVKHEPVSILGSMVKVDKVDMVDNSDGENIPKNTQKPYKLDSLEDFSRIFNEKNRNMQNLEEEITTDCKNLENNQNSDIECVKNENVVSKTNVVSKEKSDRELQFYESPETVSIENKCTKDEVLKLIKDNPKIDVEGLYKTLGDGSFKFLRELVSENVIRSDDNGIWEVNENV